MGKRVAVVLAGCGVYDGSEIHESSAVLVHLSREGAQVRGTCPISASFCPALLFNLSLLLVSKELRSSLDNHKLPVAAGITVKPKQTAQCRRCCSKRGERPALCFALTLCCMRALAWGSVLSVSKL